MYGSLCSSKLGDQAFAVISYFESNRRLNEHGIYIRHCQESNSQSVPSQAGADPTRPQWRILKQNTIENQDQVKKAKSWTRDASRKFRRFSLAFFECRYLLYNTMFSCCCQGQIIWNSRITSHVNKCLENPLWGMKINLILVPTSIPE